MNGHDTLHCMAAITIGYRRHCKFAHVNAYEEAFVLVELDSLDNIESLNTPHLINTRC